MAPPPAAAAEPVTADDSPKPPLAEGGGGGEEGEGGEEGRSPWLAESQSWPWSPDGVRGVSSLKSSATALDTARCSLGERWVYAVRIRMGVRGPRGVTGVTGRWGSASHGRERER